MTSDYTTNEVDRIIEIVIKCIPPGNRFLMGDPELARPCLNCNHPMCSVKAAGTYYYLCLSCGHKEFRE